MNLADPNQWAAYTYANNNPITNWDPTGLVTHGDFETAGQAQRRQNKANPAAPVRRTANPPVTPFTCRPASPFPPVTNRGGWPHASARPAISNSFDGLGAGVAVPWVVSNYVSRSTAVLNDRGASGISQSAARWRIRNVNSNAALSILNRYGSSPLVRTGGRALPAASMALNGYFSYQDSRDNGDPDGLTAAKTAAGVGAAGMGIGVGALGGAAAAWATGALVGATAGSIVPVVGTIVGAVVGAAIGGIATYHLTQVSTAALDEAWKEEDL